MVNTGRDLPAVTICEPHLRRVCPSGASLGQVGACECVHEDLPYTWQVCSSLPDTWVSLTAQNEQLERAYCQASVDTLQIEVVTNDSDGSQKRWLMTVDFESMMSLAVLCTSAADWVSLSLRVRRLSTPSYCTSVTPLARTDRYLTQWRWYYQNGPLWTPFAEDKEVPSQYTLETKYLSGQEVYRFKHSVGSQSKTPSDFLLDFNNMVLRSLSDNGMHDFKLKRRPIYISKTDKSQGLYLLSPHYKPLPYVGPFPKEWVPMDPSQRYEMVPLNPESVRYHLVVSEISKTLTTFHVADVFAIQNPYMWQRFESKRVYMQQQQQQRSTSKTPSAPQALELQLFHGTPTATSAEAILSQGFDPRLSGKHAVVYGDGCYFAADASLSDKYTSTADLAGKSSSPSNGNNMRWMFLARVLVGKYAQGSKGLRRPPPLDPSMPHAEYFDSCVDNTNKPKIYVVFDCDQCYPEYLVGYTHKSP